MFGSMQMAVSRVIKLQHHRIAQVLAAVLEAVGAWVLVGRGRPGPDPCSRDRWASGCRAPDSGPPGRLPVQSPSLSAVFDL